MKTVEDYIYIYIYFLVIVSIPIKFSALRFYILIFFNAHEKIIDASENKMTMHVSEDKLYDILL